MFAVHARLDNRLLSACYAIHSPERGKAEITLQLRNRVERVAAIAASGIAAVVVAQFGNQTRGIGKLVAHPRRKYRIASRNGQPRERIGKRDIEFGPVYVLAHQSGKTGFADFQTACFDFVLHHVPNMRNQRIGVVLCLRTGNDDAVCNPIRQCAEQPAVNTVGFGMAGFQIAERSTLVLKKLPAGAAVGFGRIERG